MHSKEVFLLWFPLISSRYQTAKQTQSGRGFGRTLASAVSGCSPCGNLGVFLAIVSQYKPQTGGPVRAHPWHDESATDSWIRIRHSLHSWAASQAHTLIYFHTVQYFCPAPWTWETVSPQKVITSSLWEVISLPFCLLRQVWIWTQFLPIWWVVLPSLPWFLCLTSSVVHLRPSPWLSGRMSLFSGSTCPLAPGGIFSWQSRGCAPVTREVTNHCLHNPRRVSKKCCGNLNLRYRTLRQFSRKQCFIVLAWIQRTRAHRLSLGNKEVLPYIPL
jgi:hypothetical protein